MLKSELLELIADLEEGAEVDELLTNNEEIKGLIKPLALNEMGVEDFNKLLASNKIVKSSLDSAISKGVEAFKKNKMPKEIEKAIEERENQSKDPVALELAQLKKELAKEKLVGKYTNELAKEGLSEFADLLLNTDDEEVITKNIELLKNNVTTLVTKQVETTLKGGSYTPPQGGQALGKITWEQVNANPSLMDKYIEQNNEI